MMPLRLFRSRNFSGANILTLLLYAGLGGTLYFLPFLLIQVHGYSATGSSFVPFTIITFVMSWWAGGLVTRFGARLPLMFGPVIAAAGFVLFALPGIGGSYWTTFYPALLVLGIFVFLVFSVGLDARVQSLDLSPQAQQQLEAEKVNLGGVQAPADVSEGTAVKIERAIQGSFLAGFRLAMFMAAGLAVASAVAAAAIMEVKRRIAPAERAGQPEGKPALPEQDIYAEVDANVPAAVRAHGPD
jgi:hypothetical protein